MVSLDGNPVAHLNEYELRHLVAHLEATGRTEDLHRLLALESSNHSNAWYEAKEAIADTAGYLGELAIAWRISEDEFTNRCSQLAIGLQCRYALIVASVECGH